METVRIHIHIAHGLEGGRVIYCGRHVVLPAPVSDRSEGVESEEPFRRPPQIRLEAIVEGVKPLDHILYRVLLNGAVGRGKEGLVFPQGRISGNFGAECVAGKPVSDFSEGVALVADVP